MSLQSAAGHWLLTTLTTDHVLLTARPGPFDKVVRGARRSAAFMPLQRTNIENARIEKRSLEDRTMKRHKCRAPSPTLSIALPRVARPSQPWALLRNPFGIFSRNVCRIPG